MKNKKIVIAGGTGFMGQALTAYFGKENSITILSRQAVTEKNNNYKQTLLTPASGYNVTYRRWDGKNLEKHWVAALDGADVIINLAGKSVNCRYTEVNKKEIFDSRTNATKAIAAAIVQSSNPPKLWINAASATIYRHATDCPQDEYTGELGNGFSVDVCKLWEETFYAQPTPLTRKVVLRTAIVLGHGGVMVPYLNLLKFGFSGAQGNGKQMYSWIHIDDVCRMIEWITNTPAMQGTYNCAAPNPVTNTFFMHTLRSAAGKRMGLPAYEWMLTFGTLLIGTEKELLLKSRWVVPVKMLETGFTFTFAFLTDAIKDIIGKTDRKKYSLF